MSPATRTLLQVSVVDADAPDPKRDEKDAAKTVERLMGRKPELRFAFIQERARFVGSDELDV